MLIKIISILFFCFGITMLYGKTVVVTTKQKNELKSIIENSNAFDTITIEGGHYFANNINVKHTLAILGKNNPTIDGGLKGEIFTVSADFVTMSGLVLQNTGTSNLKEFAAIKMYNSRFCIIQNNQIKNCFFGIYLSNSTRCIINGNTINGNGKDESASGNGIHLWKSSDVLIIHNKIGHHRDGIYFEFVTKTKIIRNYSHENLRYGLHFMFSDRNTYQYNSFTNNGAGVAVMYTSNIIMKNNVFDNNWGDAAYGLLLKDISNSIITNNLFLKNTTGIYMEGSGRLQIRENQFENNGWAFKIMANCIEDSLCANNFTGNSFDVSTNGVSNENYFDQNYWDNYKGYDLNHDKIGDIPYRPVSLFSLIVEEIPHSILLMRSFMVDILNQAEKTAPVFIPEAIVDNRPAMHMYGYNYTKHL